VSRHITQGRDWTVTHRDRDNRVRATSQLPLTTDRRVWREGWCVGLMVLAVIVALVLL
jgi:hypothetical protein